MLLLKKYECVLAHAYLHVCLLYMCACVGVYLEAVQVEKMIILSYGVFNTDKDLNLINKLQYCVLHGYYDPKKAF